MENKTESVSRNYLSLDEMIKLAKQIPMTVWNVNRTYSIYAPSEIYRMSAVFNDKLNIRLRKHSGLFKAHYSFEIEEAKTQRTLGFEKGEKVKEYFNSLAKEYVTVKKQIAIETHNAAVTEARTAIQSYQPATK